MFEKLISIDLNQYFSQVNSRILPDVRKKEFSFLTENNQSRIFVANSRKTTLTGEIEPKHYVYKICCYQNFNKSIVKTEIMQTQLCWPFLSFNSSWGIFRLEVRINLQASIIKEFRHIEHELNISCSSLTLIELCTPIKISIKAVLII